MEAIRLATEQEINKIKDTADITLSSRIIAMDNPKGEADIAVIRQCVEVDPVYFSDASATNRRAMFLWGIENILRFQGSPEYYFNISPDDESWKKIVEHWGAREIFNTPQQRYKKVLL